MSEFKTWECQICNWIYDEEQGYPEDGLAPGTRWEDVPGDWCCPECGVGKDDFEMREVVESDVPAESDGTRQIQCQSDIQAQNHNSGNESPLVIIGTGLAGYNLVKELRHSGYKNRIVMYTADDGSYYSKPQLSTGFSNNKNARAMVLGDAESQAQEFDIDIHIYTPIAKIDTTNKRLFLAEGGMQSYSKLVLATGSHAIAPPINGDALGKVLTINNLEDFAKFRTLAKPNSHILVMGAGLIGTEYADDLTRSGYQVTVVDPQLSALANLLPHHASKKLTDELTLSGIEFKFGTVVETIEKSPDGVRAILKSGEQINVDFALSAIGVKPNIQLAKHAGIHCDKGIVVAPDLHTSAPDIFAIGDCAQVYDQVRPYIAPLNNQVKTLAKLLMGQDTEVNYNVMPIVVKSKIHPVITNPPSQDHGEWIIDNNDDQGCRARYVSSDGELCGFALTGAYISDSKQLSLECRVEN